LQLHAKGVWQWSRDEEQTAKVIFDAFSIQATQLFHQSSWQMPQLEIPVLDLLKNEAIWKTTYLDRDLRIGRGATGNVFVFQRSLFI